jgi:hypothetical protein
MGGLRAVADGDALAFNASGVDIAAHGGWLVLRMVVVVRVVVRHRSPRLP